MDTISKKEQPSEQPDKFTQILRDFINSISDLVNNEEKFLSQKQEKAFNEYKKAVLKQKIGPKILLKIKEGFQAFFENFDFVIFSETKISTIKANIYYGKEKTNPYIPLIAILKNCCEVEDVMREFLSLISHILEENVEKKEAKRKFIFSRKIFGLNISDETPEGRFICKWIMKAKGIIPVEELMTKDTNGMIGVIMALIASGKIAQFTEEIRNDWMAESINLPSLLRRAADIIEAMGLDKQMELSSGLPILLRNTSTDLEDSSC